MAGTYFRNLNTTRRIGIRTVGALGVLAIITLTLMVAAGPAGVAHALGAESKITFAIAFLSYPLSMFTPALLGWRYLRQVEREYGKSVRVELMARFVHVRPGEPVSFTLQQIIDDVRATELKAASNSSTPHLAGN